MYPNFNPLSIPSITSKISKTLSIANQVIPLYVKAKPMILDAKNNINSLKNLLNTKVQNIDNNLKNVQKEYSKITTPLKQKKETPKAPFNNPTFFI